MKAVLLVLAGIWIACTALPLLRTDVDWVRALDFPRVQIAVLASVTALLLLLRIGSLDLRARLVLLLLGVAVAYQAWTIYPYTPLAAVEVPACADLAETDRLRLLVANVRQDNRDPGRLLAFVTDEQPDVVLLMEVDAWWTGQLAPLRGTHPFLLEHPLPNTYGIALYARLPLHGAEVEFLAEDDVPSIHTDVELDSGVLVGLHVVHPRPPRLSGRRTESDLPLIVLAHRVRSENRAAVVCGDFNDVGWSRTMRRFQRISRMLDPRVGRGTYATFDANGPLLRYPLDHVFCSAEFELVRQKLGPDIGSDHFPFLCELCLPRAEE